ncbi:conserved exported hypothetical protein [Tenacibaculum sp. 190524A05c]|uniref:hypothetical protein n=1 Tax=Tenacibaculum platacis TaxID=3137852 RepID=UPI0031FB1AF9
MKKIVLLITFTVLCAHQAFAKRARIPVCFPCEKLALVKDLPNDEGLKEGTNFLNLGYLYEEYSAVWIPAWNTKGKYVLINEDETVYYEITDAQLAELETKYNLELSEHPLSFWKKIGGKAVYIIIIGLIIWGKLSPDNEEEEEPQTEAAEKTAE